VYYNPETWMQPRKIVAAEALMAFNEVVAKQRATALEAMGVDDLAPEIEQDYRERVDLGRGMLKYHLNVIAPEIDEGLTPVMVEVPFLIDICDPDTGENLLCPLCGTQIVFGGRIDAIIRDHYDSYWIFDWKTAVRLHADDDEFLATEEQITNYTMAVRRKLNADIRGFIYHEQKKGYPKEPEPLTRTYKGRNFSTNKQQDTDYKTFVRTLYDHGENLAAYEEYLNYLQENPPRYYLRHRQNRNENELLEAERNLYLVAKEMTDPNTYKYPSPGRFSCGSCAFRIPCIMKNDGSDFEYTLETMYEKRQKQYWEREESSTDTVKDTVG
jgi:hypothetical protein